MQFPRSCKKRTKCTKKWSKNATQKTVFVGGTSTPGVSRPVSDGGRSAHRCCRGWDCRGGSQRNASSAQRRESNVKGLGDWGPPSGKGGTGPAEDCRGRGGTGTRAGDTDTNEQRATQTQSRGDPYHKQGLQWPVGDPDTDYSLQWHSMIRAWAT